MENIFSDFSPDQRQLESLKHVVLNLYQDSARIKQIMDAMEVSAEAREKYCSEISILCERVKTNADLISEVHQCN